MPMTSIQNYPELQVILNVIPTSWRVGLHWHWATTRTVVLDLGPVSVAFWAHDVDEAQQ